MELYYIVNESIDEMDGTEFIDNDVCGISTNENIYNL
jgi:hypothetical protein